MSVTRFGVSLEEGLLKALDGFVKEKNFPNRSQAIRHLIEKNLVEKKWASNSVVAGVIVMAYDHHKRDITNKSNDVQHDYHDVILANQHFHLSHDYCLEIIAVKGEANRLIELSERLTSIKGIKDGQLVMSHAD
ncbi:MAG: nickel-responsive transcriptional regulator NikR [Chlorobiales bacterium]|nr:nickel-responsive transcriptional regulator NikR [Chlorobiales bacterium]